MHVHVYIRSRNRLKVSIQQLLKRLSLRQLELHGTKRANTYLCSCGYHMKGEGQGQIFPTVAAKKKCSRIRHTVFAKFCVLCSGKV